MTTQHHKIDGHILFRTGVLQNLDGLADISNDTATREARLQAVQTVAPLLEAFSYSHPDSRPPGMKGFYLLQLVDSLWQMGRLTLAEDQDHLQVPTALAAIRQLIEEYDLEAQTKR